MLDRTRGTERSRSAAKTTYTPTKTTITGKSRSARAPVERAVRTCPIRDCSPSNSAVIRNPLRTKNMSTPRKPPLGFGMAVTRSSPMWNQTTSSTATPRMPSKAGIRPSRRIGEGGVTIAVPLSTAPLLRC